MTTLLEHTTTIPAPSDATGHGIATGDVLEIDLDGEDTSALVLLATDQALILDPCDGRTPFVLRADELTGYRKFDPALDA